MIKIAQHNLFEELKTLGYQPNIQKETEQIYVILKHEKREFPLFVRILHDGELLQLLTFIPCNVKDEQFGEVARFLHMLNKEVDMPGFCLDEVSKTCFYRLMIPTFKKEISKKLFEALLNTSQLVCKTFSPVIEALAFKAITLEEVLKKAEEAKTNQKV